jgi:hypothetical protein
MSLVPEDLTKWDLENLLREFERCVKLEKAFDGVGGRYQSLIHAKVEALGTEAIRRTGLHPNWWRVKGVVPSSWTDEHGITHTWQHWMIQRKPDDSPRMVTCLLCIAKEFV